jgi:Rieske Fe-S protein
MLALMEEKVERDFMSTTKLLGFALLLMSCSLLACKDDAAGDNPVPTAPVNLTINTDLPTYFKLKTLGNYVYEEGGNRGVLIIHGYDDNFYAFDRLCTHLPDLSCSLIHVDSMRLNLRCGTFKDTSWKACCDSKYQLDGNVLQGPAKYPLRQYPVTFSGSTIYVRN